MTKVHTSTNMTGKMKGFHSINTNTVTNPFCQKMAKTEAVCKNCYSCKMLKGFYSHNVAPVFERNSQLLSTTKIVDKQITKTRKKHFRLHAHGELINSLHFENFLTIAKKNNNTTYAIWTKRTDIVAPFIEKGLIPKNLILIYSNPVVNSMNEEIPKGFHKIFTVYKKDFVKDNKIDINCGAKSCMSCMSCYKFDTDTKIREVLK